MTELAPFEVLHEAPGHDLQLPAALRGLYGGDLALPERCLYANFVGVWNILFPPILTQQQMEDRKIYNTYMHGQGNEGHEFTSVLTDDERLAILEYLKTL